MESEFIPARRVQQPSYWGPATSSVDWCEENYVHSPYVAETWNSLSSLAMLAVGFAGAYLHAGSRWVDVEFLWAFLAVAVVGIGSLLFHATLRREWQAADEVPMLCTVLIYVYILVSDKFSLSPTQRRALKWSLMIWSCIVTLLVTLTSGSVQFYLFHLSFGSAEFWSLYQIYLVYNRKRAESLETRWAFETGAKLYAAAVALWAIDLFLCNRVNGGSSSLLPFNPQLHAFWHVLVSLGLYHLALVALLNRVVFDGNKRRRPEVRLEFAAGLLPYISFIEK